MEIISRAKDRFGLKGYRHHAAIFVERQDLRTLHNLRCLSRVLLLRIVKYLGRTTERSLFDKVARGRVVDRYN